MKKIKIVLIILISIGYIYIYGCRSIHVGGSGEAGGVHGSGEIMIPVPKND